jgi:hypothetical protein
MEKTLTIRKIPKEVLHSMKRMALGKRLSLNSYLLNLMDVWTATELSERKKLKINNTKTK